MNILPAAVAAGDFWAANTGIVNLGLGVAGAAGLGYTVGSNLPIKSERIKMSDPFTTPKRKRRRGGSRAPKKANVGGGAVPTKKDDIRKDTAQFGRTGVVHVVGDPDLAKQDEVVFLGRVKGWSFPRGKYIRDSREFSPATFMLGDTLTTSAATLDKSAVIVSGVSGTMTANHNRWYDSDDVLVEKKFAQARSICSVNGKYTNQYADFCIPILPNHSYGVFDLGSSTKETPIGLQDLFSTISDGPSGNNGVFSVGMNPYILQYGTVNPSTLAGGVTGNTNDTRAGYMSVDTEIRVYNDVNTTQTYEIYLLAPRRVTRKSPLFEMHECHQTDIECSDGYDQKPKSYLNVGHNIMKYKNMRKSWKVLKKVTLSVVKDHYVTLRIRCPLSKVRNNILHDLLEGSTFTSVPGLTSWVYIRARGIQTLNNEDGIISCMYGSMLVDMHQKLTALGSRDQIKKYIDMRVLKLVDREQTTDQFEFEENVAVSDETDT